MRHRPFFPHPNHLLLPPASPPTSELAAVRRGSLEVTVLDVSRLNPLLQGDGVYCIMALGMFLIRSCPKETGGLFHLNIVSYPHHNRQQSLAQRFAIRVGRQGGP